jgi:hypothetical protein
MVTLEGEKVVVTGGSRGLGLGIVEALVAQKAHVTVGARAQRRHAAADGLASRAHLGKLQPGVGRRREGRLSPGAGNATLSLAAQQPRDHRIEWGGADGSPLSGSYAGAKRMLWLMALYANSVAQGLDLGICFQAIVPQQIIGDTELGRKAAEAYARSKGVSLEVARRLKILKPDSS